MKVAIQDVESSDVVNADKHRKRGLLYCGIIGIVVAVSLAVSLSLSLNVDPPVDDEPSEEDLEFEINIDNSTVLAELNADFSYLEDCQAYGLPFCLTSAQGEPPYANFAMKLKDNIWWFEDKVSMVVRQVVVNLNIYWEVKITVKFGHDPLREIRSGVFSARLTENRSHVLLWRKHELLNESTVIRCSEEDSSVWDYEDGLVEQLATNPLLIFAEEENGIDPASFERTGNFGVVVNVSDISEGLSNSTLLSLENVSSVMVETSAAAGPSAQFADIKVIEVNSTVSVEDFLEFSCDVWADLGLLELSSEIPTRDSLSLNQTFNFSLANATSNTSSVNTTSRRRLFFDPPGSDTWISWQDSGDVIPFSVLQLDDVLPFLKGNETMAQAYYDEHITQHLGTAGLEHVNNLLNTLDELEGWINEYRQMFEELDSTMALLLYLLVLLEDSSRLVSAVDAANQVLIKILKVVVEIPQARPYAQPILLYLSRAQEVVITPTNQELSKVQLYVKSSQAKEKLTRDIVINEGKNQYMYVAEMTKQALVDPILHTLRNCENTDAFAQTVLEGGTIQNTIEAFNTPWDRREILLSILPGIDDLNHLIDVLTSLDTMFELLQALFAPIRNVLDGFIALFDTEVSIPVLGFFCQETIPPICIDVPCGVKTCKRRYICGVSCGCSGFFSSCKCRNRYCTLDYPCGVKYCERCTVSLKIQVLCYKSMSFNVFQVLNDAGGLLSSIYTPLKEKVDDLFSNIPVPGIPLLPELVNIVGPVDEVPSSIEKVNTLNEDLFTEENDLPYLDNLMCDLANEVPAVTFSQLEQLDGPGLKNQVASSLHCDFWDGLPTQCSNNVPQMFCGATSCGAPTLLPTVSPSASPTTPTVQPPGTCFQEGLVIDEEMLLDDIYSANCTGCLSSTQLLGFELIEAVNGSYFFELEISSDISSSCRLNVGDELFLASFHSGNHYLVAIAEDSEATVNGASILVKANSMIELSSPMVAAPAPLFESVTIDSGGTLTTSAFNGNEGGLLYLRAKDWLIFGEVSMTAKGARGGTVSQPCPENSLGLRNCTKSSIAYSTGNGCTGGADVYNGGASGAAGAVLGASGSGGIGCYGHSLFYDIHHDPFEGSVNLSIGATPDSKLELNRNMSSPKTILGSGGVHGGMGGEGGLLINIPTCTNPTPQDSFKCCHEDIPSIPSQGSPGSAGGGVIYVEAEEGMFFASTATVRANGASGGNGGNGGVGGYAWYSTDEDIGGFGGGGGGGGGGAGGSGGTVIVVSKGTTNFDGTVDVSGGQGGIGGQGGLAVGSWGTLSLNGGKGGDGASGEDGSFFLLD